jgi:hypothetical protein
MIESGARLLGFERGELLAKATLSNASLWRGRKDARTYAMVGTTKPIAAIIVRYIAIDKSKLTA